MKAGRRKFIIHKIFQKPNKISCPFYMFRGTYLLKFNKLFSTYWQDSVEFDDIEKKTKKKWKKKRLTLFWLDKMKAKESANSDQQHESRELTK